MENTLWGTILQEKGEASIGLNPYYNGKYSMSFSSEQLNDIVAKVLILIIMENTLWDSNGDAIRYRVAFVLILIIMENTLWAVLIHLI